MKNPKNRVYRIWNVPTLGRKCFQLINELFTLLLSRFINGLHTLLFVNLYLRIRIVETQSNSQNYVGSHVKTPKFMKIRPPLKHFQSKVQIENDVKHNDDKNPSCQSWPRLFKGSMNKYRQVKHEIFSTKWLFFQVFSKVIKGIL